jgi:hypothetical protein
LWRKQKNAYYVQYLFLENRAVYEIMPKNVVDAEGPQMTSQYGAYVLHAGYARLHALTFMHMLTLPVTQPHKHARTHTRAQTQKQICNINCCFKATMFSRTHPNVMLLYVHCVSYLSFNVLCEHFSTSACTVFIIKYRAFEAVLYSITGIFLFPGRRDALYFEN